MNKDIAQGGWTELKGKIKAKWAKLTDHDLDEVKGDMEILAGKIQKTYGYAKDKAEQEYKDFKATLNEKKSEKKAEMKSRLNDDVVQEDYEIKKTKH